MSAPLSQRFPFVIIVAAIVCGIFTASLADGSDAFRALTFSTYAAFIGSALTCAAIIAYLVVERSNYLLRYALLAAIVLTTAATYLVNVAPPPPDRIRSLIDNGEITSGEAVVLYVTATRPAEPRPGASSFIAHVGSINFGNGPTKASGRVRIFVDHETYGSNLSDAIDAGTQMRIGCRLFREDRYRNFGAVSTVEMLDRQNIDATCSPQASDSLELIGGSDRLEPFNFVYRWRRAAIEAFAEHLSSRTAGILSAALLGNKFYLDKQTAEMFRVGGTFHVLVISGLHISFIGGLILLVVRRMSGRRWLHFIAAAATLWAYTIAVGAELPAIRAALMFTVMLFGYAIYRKSSPLNSLFVCVAVILAFDPQQLFDASFQLTIVAVAAIVGFAIPFIECVNAIGSWTPSPATPLPPRVSRFVKRSAETIYWDGDIGRAELQKNVWSATISKEPFLPNFTNGIVRQLLRFIFESMTVTLVVQIAMLPLTAYYFYRFVPFAAFLNIWTSFWMIIVAAFGITATLASLVSETAAGLLFNATGSVTSLLTWLPESIADLPFADIRTAVYSGSGRWLYLVYLIAAATAAVAIIAALRIAIRRDDRRSRPSIAITASLITATLATIIIFHPFSRNADGRLRVSIIDVGQGDSILIETPNGSVILIDGGGTPQWKRDLGEDPFEPDIRGVGEVAVAATLFRRGIANVDIAMLTHADGDHAAGLAEVIRTMPVTELLTARVETEGEAAELFHAARDARTQVELVSSGSTFVIDGVDFTVLHPAAGSDDYDNDNSLVLLVKFGAHSFMLTGDIERKGEHELLRRWSFGPVDVVKIPHHGSRTSSTQEFVDATVAKYAVVSAARRSQFGHPHRGVVERWLASGTTILSTQISGMITFTTDGRAMSLETVADTPSPE